MRQLSGAPFQLALALHTTEPVHVVLVGPGWWVAYVVTPAISVVVALLSVYAGHRWALSQQAKAFQAEKRKAERDLQVQQNVTLETLANSLRGITELLVAATHHAQQPPSVDLAPVLEVASSCGVGQVLAPLLQAQAQYETARVAWKESDQATVATMVHRNDALREAVGNLTVIVEAILRSGQSHLNRLDQGL